MTGGEPAPWRLYSLRRPSVQTLLLLGILSFPRHSILIFQSVTFTFLFISCFCFSYCKRLVLEIIFLLFSRSLHFLDTKICFSRHHSCSSPVVLNLEYASPWARVSNFQGRRKPLGKSRNFSNYIYFLLRRALVNSGLLKNAKVPTSFQFL